MLKRSLNARNDGRRSEFLFLCLRALLSLYRKKEIENACSHDGEDPAKVSTNWPERRVNAEASIANKFVRGEKTAKALSYFAVNRGEMAANALQEYGEARSRTFLLRFANGDDSAMILR
jgi:hypothetical protein